MSKNPVNNGSALLSLLIPIGGVGTGPNTEGTGVAPVLRLLSCLAPHRQYGPRRVAAPPRRSRGRCVLNVLIKNDHHLAKNRKNTHNVPFHRASPTISEDFGEFLTEL